MAGGRVRDGTGVACPVTHKKSYDIHAFSFLQVGTSNHSVGQLLSTSNPSLPEIC